MLAFTHIVRFELVCPLFKCCWFSVAIYRMNSIGNAVETGLKAYTEVIRYLENIIERNVTLFEQ